MRQKESRDRRKSGKFVESSVLTDGPVAAAVLDEMFTADLLDGETLPGFLTMFRLLQRKLAAAREELAAATTQHLREVDNDIRLRQRRDALLERLTSTVSRFRNALNSIFGPGSGLVLAGLEGATAREPEALLAQIELILDRLQEPEAVIGPPELPGFSMSPETFVAALGPDYVELKTLVDGLNDENRKSNHTLIAKNEAADRYDRLFAPIAGALQAFYVLAGMDELARRVKPSTRRPGRTQVAVDDQAPSSDSEPGDAEGTTATDAESGTGATEAA
jgi:hypothetical protein